MPGCLFPTGGVCRLFSSSNLPSFTGAFDLLLTIKRGGGAEGLIAGLVAGAGNSPESPTFFLNDDIDATYQLGCYDDGGGGGQATGVIPTAGVWYHVSIGYDGVSSYTLRIVAEGGGTGDIDVTTLGTGELAAIDRLTFWHWTTFTGTEDVRIARAILLGGKKATDAEFIQQGQRRAPSPALTPNVNRYYPFDNAANVTLDASGNGYNLTVLAGSATHEADDPGGDWDTSWVTVANSLFFGSM